MRKVNLLSHALLAHLMMLSMAKVSLIARLVQLGTHAVMSNKMQARSVEKDITVLVVREANLILARQELTVTLRLESVISMSAFLALQATTVQKAQVHQQFHPWGITRHYQVCQVWSLFTSVHPSTTALIQPWSLTKATSARLAMFAPQEVILQRVLRLTQAALKLSAQRELSLTEGTFTTRSIAICAPKATAVSHTLRLIMVESWHALNIATVQMEPKPQAFHFVRQEHTLHSPTPSLSTTALSALLATSAMAL